MTIRRWLGVALAVHVGLLGLLAAFYLRTLRDSQRTAEAIAGVSAELVLFASRQGPRLQQLEDAVAKFGVTRDAGYLRRAEELRLAVSAELEQALALPVRRDEREALEGAESAWADARRALAAVSEGGRDVAAAELLRATLAEAQASFETLGAVSRTVMRERTALAAAGAARAERLSVAVALLAILLATGTAVLLSRAIAAPLQRLIRGTEEVSHGRFVHRLPPERGKEFAQVAQSFNAMTARLDSLDRMKREFVSMVSHDLKSPLASMRESTRLMLDGLSGPLTPQQRRILALQEESAERLSRMIAKLLDLSRAEAGIAVPDAVVALAEVMEDAARQAEPVAAARLLRIRLALDAAPTVRGDAEALRTLLDNLVENALKFAPEGSEVLLEAHAEGAEAVLRVSDRGPGVAPEARERIFDRFHQTTVGRDVPGRGVGLGLTICREVARIHGGSIAVHPRSGGGSTFEVRLPLDGQPLPRLGVEAA